MLRLWWECARELVCPVDAAWVHADLEPPPHFVEEGALWNVVLISNMSVLPLRVTDQQVNGCKDHERRQAHSDELVSEGGVTTDSREVCEE